MPFDGPLPPHLQPRPPRHEPEPPLSRRDKLVAAGLAVALAVFALADSRLVMALFFDHRG